MSQLRFTIRPASSGDSEAILAVLAPIAAQGVYTAISEPWTVAAQRRYLDMLSPREAVHVAADSTGRIIGYQTLDLWAPTLASMAHVGQVGTFLAPESRRLGIGRALFQSTARFAREHGFTKLVIQVRASNGGAQAFYRCLGFIECGRLSRQVRIGTIEDDELLMELFL